MKKIHLILPGIVIVIMLCTVLLLPNKHQRYEKYLLSLYAKDYPLQTETLHSEKPKPDKPHLAAQQDYYATLDPHLQLIPSERLYTAFVKVKNNPSLKNSSLSWTELTSNMGGRVRSLMYDPNDGQHKKVWAGSVTGGLWVNNDITHSDSAWQIVDDLWESLSVGCLAFDPQNPEVLYAGTGEAQTAVNIYRESSGKGVGIYKSSNGGKNWNLIPSTSKFSYVTDLVVRIENYTSTLYAAVSSGTYKGVDHSAQPSDGLYQSKDEGETWKQVLPLIEGMDMPYTPSDIVITPTGRIFVGTTRNLQGTGGGCILWSDNGLNWTLIDQYKTLIEQETDPRFQIPGRVLMASTPASPSSIYAVIAAGGYTEENFIYYRGKYLIRSDNEGANWYELNQPSPDGAWSTLAWHALTLAVSPTDPNTIFAGGLDLHKTTNGGTTWRQLSSWYNFGPYYSTSNYPYVHADQHRVVFHPQSADTAWFCTDGGVFGSYNAEDDSLVLFERNKGFNSLQFYTCALHPDAGATWYVAGSQDNGTLISKDKPLSVQTDMVSGGDGAYCFFDSDQPEYLITSVYHNLYYINQLRNGRYSLQLTANDYYNSTGTFINPADYNPVNNTLYANAAGFAGNYTDHLLRISNILALNYTASVISLNTGTGVPFSAIRLIDPLTDELLAGTQSGRLFRISGADVTPQSNEIGSSSFPTANISCIEKGQSNNELLVTFSNYGIESVWYSQDGGESWHNKEGNLPDIPVRWAVFNPYLPKQVILATELGVWISDDITQSEVNWQQLAGGFPNVRVDMLRVRKSDNSLLAATHGRGMFITTLDGFTALDESALSNTEIDFTVYPNPFQNEICIETNAASGLEGELKVYEVSGKLVHSQLFRSRTDRTTISTSKWKKGVYIVTLQSETTLISKRVVKK
ncbi:MAG: T9SS type A sorting domain-containing protein [Bacteroidota bacterium]|nr:MAG: T9SS type A sorting domain-containing protein [Bacteroidota bacterium]